MELKILRIGRTKIWLSPEEEWEMTILTDGYTISQIISKVMGSIYVDPNNTTFVALYGNGDNDELLSFEGTIVRIDNASSEDKYRITPDEYALSLHTDIDAYDRTGVLLMDSITMPQTVSAEHGVTITELMQFFTDSVMPVVKKVAMSRAEKERTC